MLVSFALYEDISGSQTLSHVIGWVSIACWLVVYAPQIIENYQHKSGEGLSVSFVFIWLIGDLCSLAGALLAHLLPTVIILAIYYTACDMILLLQIYYYRWTNATSMETSSRASDQTNALTRNLPEYTPLLGNNDISTASYDKRPIFRAFAKYAGALMFVFAVGVAAWALDEAIHQGQTPSTPQKEVVEWRSQALGWTSAVMYLGARVPQIVKNFETKCEGLSPFLFVYSITGNATYILSILAASMETKHLVANASWLAGSALTVFLDVFVLCQFFYHQAVVKRESPIV